MHSINGFVVFMQVAETRSLVAAGRQLGISASAVGKQLARLEEKLRVRLFHRSTRSVTLTAEGTLFLQRCRRVMAEIEAAQLELSQANAAPSGRLRVSLPLVSSLLLPVLGEFIATYPHIELDLDFSDRLVDVIEEGFDAVVRTGQPGDSRLASRRLGSFRMQLVASPDYLSRRGIPQRPADLLQHSCLHYRFPHSGKLQTWALRQPTGQSELQLPTSVICNTLESRLCFALQGLGIAYLPEFAVHQAVADGHLHTVLDAYVTQHGVFHVLWPASRYATPKLRALIDFLDARVFAASPGAATGMPAP